MRAARNVREAQNAQRRHYDRILDAYEAHYDDPSSQAYRRRFIDGPLLDGIDLGERRVLEAMCGSGQTTAPLLERGARVVGLDISEAALRSFRRRWPQCGAVHASLVDSGLRAESLDAVVVVAGLHHLQPNVADAVDEVHRVLKPGGAFCFMEPHRASAADRFRRVWYRYDPLFLDNEAAIDLDALKAGYADRFVFQAESYGGNLAFLFVANSMVFRIPTAWKRLYTPLLLAAEGRLVSLQGRATSCFAVCRWRKR